MNIAINYGGKHEIVNAVNRIIALGETQVNEETISKHLYTSGLPDIDLVIRTSGEQRLSNFFIWQCAYSEFYFTPVLWPDFDESCLQDAISWYSKRNRRFGKL